MRGGRDGLKAENFWDKQVCRYGEKGEVFKKG